MVSQNKNIINRIISKLGSEKEFINWNIAIARLKQERKNGLKTKKGKNKSYDAKVKKFFINEVSLRKIGKRE